MAAWFGGLHEGSPDTRIWYAHFEGGKWGKPTLLPIPKELEGIPCWNPVLHLSGERILLFYRVGRHPRTWETRLVFSTDGGETWTAARPLPEPFLGPIKNKALEIEPGILLCPSSSENPVWSAHIERYSVGEDCWLHAAPLADPTGLSAIQPTLLHWPEGRLQALCRTQRGLVGESWSEDGGESWSALKRTELVNPNSGIDGVVLADGRAALATNPSALARSPLQILLSDDGSRWRPGPLLEKEVGEFSYPAAIQAADGRLHVTYTHNRRDIAHVVLEPGELE